MSKDYNKTTEIHINELGEIFTVSLSNLPKGYSEDFSPTNFNNISEILIPKKIEDFVVLKD